MSALDLMTKTTLFKVAENRPLSPHTFRLKIERGSLRFRAGQVVSVGVPGMGVNREYSIYSGEKDPFLELLIREIPDGVVSVALKARRAGDELEINGAYGKFFEKPDIDRPCLFVATGTGIAPFHSVIKTWPDLNYRILHGIRQSSECYDRQDYAPSRYIPCITGEAGTAFHGRVTDYLENHPVDPNTLCWLCGNHAMINDAYGILRAKGVASDDIFTEVFF